MESTYRHVKVEEYIKELLEKGVRPIQAKKNTRIHARDGIVGETIITWSEDKDGNPIIEREAQVKLDEQTGKPGHVVTKVDSNGMPIIDKNGHSNTWIISDKIFEEKYEKDPEMGISIYKPKSSIQIFVQIQDDIIIEQSGKEEKISRGGYINITNANDMYGISERDFNDTYEIVPEENTKKLIKK